MDDVFPSSPSSLLCQKTNVLLTRAQSHGYEAPVDNCELMQSQPLIPLMLCISFLLTAGSPSWSSSMTSMKPTCRRKSTSTGRSGSPTLGSTAAYTSYLPPATGENTCSVDTQLSRLLFLSPVVSPTAAEMSLSVSLASNNSSSPQEPQSISWRVRCQYVCGLSLPQLTEAVRQWNNYQMWWKTNREVSFQIKFLRLV